jgi:hypothetical protein
MTLWTRLTIALLCGIFAVGNAGAAVSLWCDCATESESSDWGDPESEGESDSLEVALPGRYDPLAQVASLAALQPRFQVAQRKPSFALLSFRPPQWLSVGTGTGGPQRCESDPRARLSALLFTPASAILARSAAARASFTWPVRASVICTGAALSHAPSEWLTDAFGRADEVRLPLIELYQEGYIP